MSRPIGTIIRDIVSNIEFDQSEKIDLPDIQNKILKSLRPNPDTSDDENKVVINQSDLEEIRQIVRKTEELYGHEVLKLVINILKSAEALRTNNSANAAIDLLEIVIRFVEPMKLLATNESTLQQAKVKDIKDLFQTGEKFTFLVGAGISADPPAGLPMGREMIDAILRFSCHTMEIPTLLSLTNLRFEQLVECVHQVVDQEFQLLDYLSESEFPNFYHYLLANMIKEGHFVMTTNFDFLIEKALLDIGVFSNDMKVVITRDDFEACPNPEKLFKAGKKALYKIHGSTRNYISGEDTRESLIATMEAFGKGKENESVFQLEPYKRPLFENITNKRTLIVLGYSGSDDFDIVPTLKQLKGIKRIIWLNYALTDPTIRRYRNILHNEINTIPSSPEYTEGHKLKIDDILQALARYRTFETPREIYRVDGIPKNILGQFYTHEQTNTQGFKGNYLDWLNEHIQRPNIFQLYEVPYLIYQSQSELENAERTSSKLLDISILEKNAQWKTKSYLYMSMVQSDKGYYLKAIEYCLEAYQIATSLSQPEYQILAVIRLSQMYLRLGQLTKSQLFVEQLADHSFNLNPNISIQHLKVNGEIYLNKGDLSQAQQYFAQALSISEKYGYLDNQGELLNWLGRVNFLKGYYRKASNYFESALNIALQLGDLRQIVYFTIDKVSILNFFDNKTHQQIVMFEEMSFKVDEINDQFLKIKLLAEFGKFLTTKRKYSVADVCFDELTTIINSIKDTKFLIENYTNLGHLRLSEKRFDKAISSFSKSKKLSEKSDYEKEIIEANLFIADVHYMQMMYSKAQKQYQNILQTLKDVGNLHLTCIVIIKLANIHLDLNDLQQALILYKTSLELAQEQDEIILIFQTAMNISDIYNKLGDILSEHRYLSICINSIDNIGAEFLYHTELTERFNQLTEMLKN